MEELDLDTPLSEHLVERRKNGVTHRRAHLEQRRAPVTDQFEDQANRGTRGQLSWPAAITARIGKCEVVDGANRR